ncbi:hypothetical protein WICPIJ_004385 [Wickerhamomyces pijperi]|uniref:Uncharacterized protein n=1 Tax=Wickerhamomyces pijperi TaxID=599730 RepID=A0A9P8Q864_WICPI|nr:hypothetical protein WICPIJ_004385 [Wickerhamomyces pijperi]
MVENAKRPTIVQQIESDAAPPVLKAEPDPMNNPVPIEPPRAIICRCLAFKPLCNGVFLSAISLLSASDKSGFFNKSASSLEGSNSLKVLKKVLIKPCFGSEYGC